MRFENWISIGPLHDLHVSLLESNPLSYYILITITASWLLISAYLLLRNTGLLLGFPKRQKGGRKNREDTPFYLLFITLFSISSVLFTVVTPFVVGRWAYRYLLPAFILPLSTLAVFLAAYYGKIPSWFKVLLFSIILLSSAYNILPKAKALVIDDFKLPYPPDVKCLDELAKHYNLQYGYSDYWNAKRVTILSHFGLRVNQIQKGFMPYWWGNNILWYSNKVGHPGEYPKYQFILTNNLPTDDLERKFGAPAITKNCSGTEVYIYNREGDLAFRNVLRSAPRRSRAQRRLDAPLPDCLLIDFVLVHALPS